MSFSIAINGTKFEWFNDFTVELNYSTVASKFSFMALFESANTEHRMLFKPFSYHDIEVYYAGNKILTGTILNQEFTTSSTKSLVKVEGYSKCGVLEDCNLPKEAYPLSFDGLTYIEAFEKVVSFFDIKITTEQEAKLELLKIADKIEIGESETVADFITKICLDKGLIVTHNVSGEIVITKLKVENQPIQTFYDNEPTLSMKLAISGQSIYSKVYSLKEQGLDVEAVSEFDINKTIDNFGGGSVEDLVSFVKRNRSITYKVQNGSVEDLPKSNRKKIGSMIKNAVKLTIEANTVLFNNGTIFRPNNVIKVKSKDCYLFKETEFFIDSVVLKQGISADTATLTCVSLMSYNEENVIDIFN